MYAGTYMRVTTPDPSLVSGGISSQARGHQGVDVIEKFIARAKRRRRRLVLPEGREERMLQAARRLQNASVAEVIVLGSPEEVTCAAARAGVVLDGIRTIDPEHSDRLETLAERYLAVRPGANIKVAQRLMRKPLFYAGMMVRRGMPTP